MSRFAYTYEDPEYDDDLTYQEQEDIDEDNAFEHIQVPIELNTP